MDEFLGHELEEWYPMDPPMGPPLPKWLAIYWPWYKPTEAQFTVTNLVISPTQVNPGQKVTISCTVTNLGSEAASYTLVLGGDFMAQKEILLNAGESMTVSFQVVPDVAKSYNVTVDSLSGTFTATGAPVADIRVENLAIVPSEVQVGQAVTISVTATNYGNTTGSKIIVCTVT